MNREDIIRMAREVGYPLAEYETGPYVPPLLETLLKHAVAAEREACAKVCEQEWNKYCVEPSGYALAVNECAAAIRSRSSEH